MKITLHTCKGYVFDTEHENFSENEGLRWTKTVICRHKCFNEDPLKNIPSDQQININSW